MRSRNVVIGVVSSVAVVAVAIGLLLVLGPYDGDEVALPERVGDLVATDVAAAYPDDKDSSKAIEGARSAADYNSDAYADVFDGAAVDTRVYTDDELRLFVTATAVRADAGPLLPQNGFADPERQGFALPTVERTTEGDVECLLLRSQPPRAGSDYEPDEAEPDAVLCQRRSGDLTLQVRAATGDTDLVVDTTDDLWDELD
ncbi:hypothetical protein [Nocardioides plantarum]|uniref:Secreted protein n=1 Tax=Nocardioides plantarum TaxID=29299 RepID=A0ABV5K5U5_9ACTN|nr:hypothetical protein [Nocardioides plantarum]